MYKTLRKTLTSSKHTYSLFVWWQADVRSLLFPWHLMKVADPYLVGKVWVWEYCLTKLKTYTCPGPLLKAR